MGNGKVRSFTDLIAWKKGHELVISVFKEIKNFPIEGNALRDQMSRCSISITSNIAEGFSRKSRREKVQFYYISLGSTTELQNQLLIGKDSSYIKNVKFIVLAQKTIIVHKLINGLKKCRGYKNT